MARFHIAARRRVLLLVGGVLVVLAAFAAIEAAVTGDLVTDAGHIYISHDIAGFDDGSENHDVVPNGSACAGATACMAALPSPDMFLFEYGTARRPLNSPTYRVDGLTLAPETPPPILS